MNKVIWAIVAISAFSAGTFIGTMVSSIPIADAVKDDTVQVVNRLERVASILTQANERLVSINEGFVEPPEPDKPQIRAALDSVKSEANNVLSTINAIESKLNGLP
jgi:hypothetical protein